MFSAGGRNAGHERAVVVREQIARHRTLREDVRDAGDLKSADHKQCNTDASKIAIMPKLKRFVKLTS